MKAIIDLFKKLPAGVRTKHVDNHLALMFVYRGILLRRVSLENKPGRCSKKMGADRQVRR